MNENQTKEVTTYLQGRVNTIEQEITDLKTLLPATIVFAPAVLAEAGAPVDPNDIKKSPDLLKPPPSGETKEEPASRWTRVCMLCHFSLDRD